MQVFIIQIVFFYIFSMLSFQFVHLLTQAKNGSVLSEKECQGCLKRCLPTGGVVAVTRI